MHTKDLIAHAATIVAGMCANEDPSVWNMAPQQKVNKAVALVLAIERRAKEEADADAIEDSFA